MPYKNPENYKKQCEKVKKWRRNTKAKMIHAMGDGCQICGYNKCNDALDFHHLDPNEKEFGFGKLRANPQAAYKIANELKKCILLCSIHHREYHAGLIELPTEFFRFDQERFDNFGKESSM